MTKGLKEHLVRCENAMHAATQALSTHEFPTDQRTLTMIGFISVLVEHHESILLLVIHGNPGSASALIRPIVEGAFRALWINGPATEADVKKFNGKDVIDARFGEIARALDDAYGAEVCSRVSKLGHGTLSTASRMAGCTKSGGVSLSERLQSTIARKISAR